MGWPEKQQKSAEGNSEIRFWTASQWGNDGAGRGRRVVGLFFAKTAKRPVPKVAENWVTSQ
jgi:hypothetical protein